MASSGFSRLACMALLCLVVASSAAEAGMTCAWVARAVASCINYARSGSGPVPPECCNGIRWINNTARTTQDRQTACKCLKSAAGNISGINYGAVTAILGTCGVSIPYKISPSTNCSSVE